MGFTENLKALLEHRGIKQTQLTEMLDVTKTRVSNYLSGRSRPDFATLVKIADILSVSVDSLLDMNAPVENAPLIFDYGFPMMIKACPDGDSEKYIPVYRSINEPLEGDASPCGFIKQNYNSSLFGYYALIVSDDDMAPDVRKGDTVYIKPYKSYEVLSLIRQGLNPVCTFSCFPNDYVGLTVRKCLFKKNHAICISSLDPKNMEIYDTAKEKLPIRGIVTGIWRSRIQKCS